jgi:hypothetical protein
MQSLVVIKHGDILQNVLLCFIAGLVMPPLAAFLLEAAKEAFRNRNPNNFPDDSCYQ